MPAVIWVSLRCTFPSDHKSLLTFDKAEEVQEASIVVPRSMLASVALNGTLGFSMVIAALFCMGDVEATLETTTGFPYMEVFFNATSNKKGATLMVSI